MMKIEGNGGVALAAVVAGLVMNGITFQAKIGECDEWTIECTGGY